MSSRFFSRGDSDSDSSSSDEEELYVEKEEAEEASEAEEESEDEFDSDEDSSSDEEDTRKGALRFLKAAGGADDSDESDEEDRDRVVKSAKDKRLDELESTIKLIENARKINDWAVISTGSCSPHARHRDV